MNIHFTARRFKAHKDVRDHAMSALKKIDKYYDGIVRADIILSYEHKPNSTKTVEIILKVHKNLLTAKEKSEDFHKSIDNCLDKLERQLNRYKAKLRMKDKRTLRRVKESLTSSSGR